MSPIDPMKVDVIFGSLLALRIVGYLQGYIAAQHNEEKLNVNCKRDAIRTLAPALTLLQQLYWEELEEIWMAVDGTIYYSFRGIRHDLGIDAQRLIELTSNKFKYKYEPRTNS